ncbi:MAG: DUF192 domain-containing protein [Planctomycetota bacterium]
MRKDMQMVSAATGVVMVPRLAIAETRFESLIGLLGHKELAGDAGFLLPRCRSIHTCFMRFALDLVFLDREGRVCKLVEAIPPWRMSSAREAQSVLELPPGAIRRAGWIPGLAVAVLPLFSARRGAVDKQDSAGVK